MYVQLWGAEKALVKVVSLDFSGTLVSPDLIDYFWLELVPLIYSKRQGIWLSEAKDEVYAAYEEVGKEELRWYLPRYWFERFGMADKLESAVAEAQSRMKVYPDVSTLRSLAGKYRLIICSNMTEDFLRRFTPKLGIGEEGYFSAVSAFSLTAKRREFYSRVAEALGMDPSELVHVGDDLKADFESPREAGWEAILLDRQRHHPEVSPCIGNLSALPSMIERLAAKATA
jgi:HAD superfamily hydrolase (TIGR01549 family)